MSDTTRSEESSQERENSPRRSPSKKVLVVVGVLAALILAYFLLPHPIKRLVTVDGKDSWSGDSVPRQRQIAWKTPSQLKVEYTDALGKESFISPLLADNGTTLYFTLRNQNGESDIYRSRLVDGGWSTAEPVAELNSPADEISGFVSADGRHFYFSSDRKDGGHGGFDLYASVKSDDGWSEPRNLGPRINTPANEYSPTLSPGGRRLFFSSNRNRRMQKRASSIAKDAAAEWDETLRAQQGLVQYDLYVTERADANEQWAAANALAGANLDNSNEGTPFVSTSGVFLYFASDRPNDSSRQANFDVYRARLGKSGVTAVENLGPGINTAANEMDPALSLSDFQLVFSSDRDSPRVEQGGDDLYALYASTATEVYEETEWTESRLAPLLDFWWWILLALLILALLLASVWWFRKFSWRRAPVPAFLLIALLIHMVIATGLFFVGIGGELAAKVRSELEDLVGVDLGQDPEEIHPTERPVFDKVTDLEAVETVQPADITRQVAVVPNVPIPTQSVAPALPTLRVDDVPTEQVLVLPPQAEIEVRESPKLTRRNTVDVAKLLQPPRAETEKPVDDSPKPMPKAPSPSINLARSNTPQLPTPADERVNPLPFSSPATAEDSSNTVASPVPPTALPSSPATAPQIARTRTSIDVTIETEKAAPEKVAPAIKTAETLSLVLGEDVDVNPENAEPNSWAIPRVFSSDAKDFARAIDRPSADNVKIELPVPSGQVVPASHDVKLALARQPRLQPSIGDAASPEPVPTGATGPTTSSTGNVQSKQESLDIKLGRGINTATPPRAAIALTGNGARGENAVKAIAEPLPSAVSVANMLASAGNYAGTPNLVRKRASLAATADQAEPESMASTTSSNATTQRVVPGVPVGLDRPDADFLKTPVKTDSKLGGIHHPQLRRLVLAGRVGERPIEAPLRLASASSGLPRRSTRGAAAFYADAGGGLEKMFDLRRNETKIDLVKMFGGNEESLKAVERGLTWMEKHQFEDGHWSLHDFNKCCKDHKKCNGHGGVKSDVAATGFGLLPFLGFGKTHLSGPYQGTIERGLKWLVDHQQQSGELTTGKEGNSRMYSHAIGAIALCEAYGLSKDPNLREPAQLSLDFIIKAQHKSSGGWRYQPNQAADTSVVGWQLMALKSGQIAGLQIPHESFAMVAKWLDQVEGKGKQRGQFRYQPGSGYSLAMSAEALLCRRYLGAALNDESIVQGANFLLKNLPKQNKESSYYWYYATQFMFHLSPEYWEKWNDAQRDMLTETQIKKGQHFGTWDPKDNWEKQGGRLYATSMRLMMLEVYFRHQPLYKLMDQ